MRAMQKEVLGLCLAGLLLSAHSGAAQAALSVQGNGTVYDSVQNISWDQDANAVKTLCDANAPLWTSFDPGSGRALADICASGGDFHWDEAVAWIAHLNANAYKGITDWRLYTTTQPDPTCSSQTSFVGYPDQGSKFGCTGGELGHMFYKAPPAGLGNTDVGCGEVCFLNTGPFVNILQDIYWSGTELAPDPSNAWEFNVGSGAQKAPPKQEVTRYAWAVRAGPYAVDIPVSAIANPAGGGTVTCDPNPVPSGQSSTCTATPNPGYGFAGWSGDCTGAGACTLSSVTAPKSVTANFSVFAIPAVGPAGLGLLASLLAGLGGLLLRRRGRH